tara:strand:- start:10 stop:207 length:198 start_codon:yes stop_codon:yes gene_type:complete
MKIGDLVRARDNFGTCYDIDGYLFNGNLGIVISVGGAYEDVKMYIGGKVRSTHFIYLEVINEKEA